MNKNLKKNYHTGNNNDQNELNEKTSIIKNVIRTIGIPVNFVGYNYIIDALIYMVETKDIVFLTEIYRLIADKYRTSKISVEISIRNAIKKAVGNREKEVKKILKVPNDVNLTNSVFLNTAKEIVIEELLKL